MSRKTLLLLLAVAVSLKTAAHAEDSDTVSLAQCFTEVMSSNTDLLTLRKDVERAVGTGLTLRSLDLPQLNAQLSAGWRAGALYGHNGPFAIITAEFSQPLFNTGMAAVERRGRCEVIAAQERLNVAVSDRLHEVRNYYLRAERLEALIILYDEIDGRLKRNVTGAQQRLDAGSAGREALLQAKVQLLSERGEVTAYRREEFEMRTSLAELMGRAMEQLPRPAAALEHAIVNVDFSTLQGFALEHRADLRFLRALIQIAREDRRVVDAGYFPYISLVASTLYIPGKRQLTAVTPIIEGQTPLGTEGRYGASLTWLILDNGLVTGASREIEAVRREYEAALNHIEQNIPRQIAQISHLMEDAQARLAALNKSQAEADEYLRLTENKVSLGEGTQLDFSDAQRHLLAVRVGIVEALYQYDSALAEIDWVTGRYLEFAAPAAGR